MTTVTFTLFLRSKFCLKGGFRFCASWVSWVLNTYVHTLMLRSQNFFTFIQIDLGHTVRKDSKDQ